MGKEVAQLEDEIMAERKRASNDTLAEQSCIDHMLQLEQTRNQLEKERASAGAQVQQAIGRRAQLTEELTRLREEVKNVEKRTAGMQHCEMDCEKRRQEAVLEEERQAMKL